MTDEQQANRVDALVECLQRFARSLRGEESDLTGIGLRRSSLMNIEWALGVRVTDCRSSLTGKYEAPFLHLNGDQP